MTASSAKGLQAIVAEMTDYSRKPFEKGPVYFGKLLNVEKIDEAFQLQSDFAKSAQKDFLASATKIGKTDSSHAKEAFKPKPAQPPVATQPSTAPVATEKN